MSNLTNLERACSKLRNIIALCNQTMTVGGKVGPIDGIQVGFVIPGKWGKTNTRRIWPGGPIGTIVTDIIPYGGTGLYVMFKASEVKAAAEKKLAELEEELS